MRSGRGNCRPMCHLITATLWNVGVFPVFLRTKADAMPFKNKLRAVFPWHVIIYRGHGGRKAESSLKEPIKGLVLPG